MMTNPNIVPAPLQVPFLALEDLANKSEAEVKAHIEDTFQKPGASARFQVLVAYESVGSWGCDSSNWFLLRDKSTGELFEAGGSHCSCYGFEGQWKPEPTTVAYLKSEKFSVGTGGYDSTRRDYTEPAGNEVSIKEWIAKNL